MAEPYAAALMRWRAARAHRGIKAQDGDRAGHPSLRYEFVDLGWRYEATRGQGFIGVITTPVAARDLYASDLAAALDGSIFAVEGDWAVSSRHNRQRTVPHRSRPAFGEVGLIRFHSHPQARMRPSARRRPLRRRQSNPAVKHEASQTGLGVQPLRHRRRSRAGYRPEQRQRLGPSGRSCSLRLCLAPRACASRARCAAPRGPRAAHGA